MWELECEESWVPKNWCFWTVVLEKTLESPLDCKEIQSVHSKGDQSCVFFWSKVKSLSHVWLFATPWIAAHQASLSITNPRSSLKLTLVMSSSHLILCHPLLHQPPIPPASESFPISQFVAWGGQSTEVTALASFLQTNTQDWSPLEWTGWISLQSKALARVFSSTTVQKHQFFSAQHSSQSNSHIHTWPQEKPQPWLNGHLLAK